jgi:hypothetical protein
MVVLSDLDLFRFRHTLLNEQRDQQHFCDDVNGPRRRKAFR